MEDRSASPASASQPPGSLQSSITAQGGAAVNAPQLVNCDFKESVNITYNHTHVTQHESHTPYTTAPDIILRVSEKLKSYLRKKYELIFEGIAKRGNPALFREIYTELYITVGETEGVNKEHEVWQIDPAFKTPHEQDTPIDCNEIFNPLNQQSLIRTVRTKGVAGIGKTVSVQKFILDWAEKKANQDIDLLFFLPFRELNRIIKEECSLHELLCDFHSELKEFDDVKYYGNCKTLFILDGLDESKLPFDFEKKRVSNVFKSASLDELITNIIEGNLLPSALVWITSRPAAIDNIPPRLIHRMTEIRGFTDLQEEDYFRKRINDENLANRIISHVKDVRTLQIMCHIPVFCWIIATVLKKILKKVKSERIPSSLTEMYTRFLLIQTNERQRKYLGKTESDPSRLPDADVQIILKLGKLAFENLMKRNIVFSEDDLRDYGIDVTEASVRSGVFTEIAREEDPMFSVKTYSFVHLSFQEYLAAFFVFYTFAVEGISLISDKNSRLYQHVTVYDKLWDHKEFGLILSNPVPAALAATHDDDDEFNNDSHFKQMVTQGHLTLHELQKNAIHSANCRSRSSNKVIV